MAAAGSVVRIVAAFLVTVGLALGGWFVERGLRELRAGDRRVSVKGLAERGVRADLALWALRFVATGDDLAQVRRTIAENEAAVRRFVAGGGIEFKLLFVRISPEIRFTRWGSDNLTSGLANVILKANRNQGQFLVGFSF